MIVTAKTNNKTWISSLNRICLTLRLNRASYKRVKFKLANNMNTIKTPSIKGES